MILSPKSIFNLNIVEPCEKAGRYKGVSYGLGHGGYDIRVAEEFVLVPGQFRLASSLERFALPNDVLGIVHDKSTWARRGLSVFNTVLEPGWSGYLTMELVNYGPEDIPIFKGVGIAQVVFHYLDAPTCSPYAGKYQDQKAGPQPAIFEEV